ncbi:F-actin-capping protein subunit beta [Polychytrium aggregatum]|uniref:F-actin-capping protein subunit beta n=1 Tax=Polychytrium aggregatum TaxID=110093 RepID=UPI0022FF05BB|nr:F-actin-capping protein subunit beta [Polychytrium aggregatum]KAI9206586.1 F-actin-capping protein subunit beta [Polychytrium aggregatum]
MTEPIDCALDLMRRLPPQHVEQSLTDLINLVPDLTDELLSAIDQPLKVQRCRQTGRDYLLCDYNRDGESYRSPWSNDYDPQLHDGTQPSLKLRKLEVSANDAFDTYREMYYEGGVSSVYMWDLDEAFAAVVLIKKTNDQGGSWDSIHVFEVQEKRREAHYKLTSTVMLSLTTGSQKMGDLSLAGSLTRQHEVDCPLDDYSAHVGNLGRIVEDVEIKMRNALQEIYFGKTREVVNDLRSATNLEVVQQQMSVTNELFAMLNKRNAGNN